MQKKGVELSMNVIIIAVIALVVLVILVVLVVRSGGQVVDGTQCAAGQGQCVSGSEAADCGDQQYIPAGGCEEGSVCCLSVGDG